jgi:hypothetical protein
MPPSPGEASGPLDPSPSDSSRDVVAFATLTTSLPKIYKKTSSKFVKKLEEIPLIQIQGTSRALTLKFVEQALICQFTGIWPSPRAMVISIDRNRKSHLKGNLSHFLSRRGFFVFLFENKVDRDLIFRSGPYFMGSRGMYLNSSTPDFNPENDIPNVVHVWVRLPFLPLHYWNNETIRSIGNTLGKFIDRA